MSLLLNSQAFEPNGPIPKKYSADGENISPPLSWSGVPAGTREFALIVDDPDAPMNEPFVHWLIYKIPPHVMGLDEGILNRPELHSPPGAMQGKNSKNRIGYDGPAPPKGHGTHHYHFRLYALNEPIQLKSGVDKKTLLEAIQNNILTETELVGLYQRS